MLLLKGFLTWPNSSAFCFGHFGQKLRIPDVRPLPHGGQPAGGHFIAHICVFGQKHKFVIFLTFKNIEIKAYTYQFVV